MARRVIEIAGRKVGDGCPPIISAEVGLNHGGLMSRAFQLIAAAAACGCDAVKFQNYRTADFVKNRDEVYDNGHGYINRMWDMCQECELAFDDLKHLKQYADNLGIIFHSTPTSREGVDDLVKLGVPVLKNGADYWEHPHLMWYMLNTGIPVVASTAKGFGQFEDWAFFWPKHPSYLIVLHTVREYPAKDWNRDRFEDVGCSYRPFYGYSDHTIGIDAAVEAVKLGACWIEKHFTLDKNMHGPDHHFSADPQEMAALVKACKG